MVSVQRYIVSFVYELHDVDVLLLTDPDGLRSSQILLRRGSPNPFSYWDCYETKVEGYGS